MNRAHPWMPVSPCGQGCLPAADSVPTVTRIRQVLRLLATAALLVAGALLVALQPMLRPRQQEQTLRTWYRTLLRVLHIQLEVTGGDRFAHPGVAILVVSNHTSWLDQIALGAVQPLRMVAKKEVGRWPVVGPLARRLGTIFVDRERLSALPGMVDAITRALAEGAAVGAFPEGTTWCGLSSGRFRPAVFQAAVDTATPVRPVALRYRLAGSGPTTVASFVGTAGLCETLIRVCGARGLVIEVHLLPFLRAACTTRRTLASRAEIAVTALNSASGTGPTDPQPAWGSLSPQHSHGGCS
ncbi:MAG: 1-acyl-sn-glycerol-3-phosphate acyltransferase [Solirubrobacterales bacterium]|nr:1-acyl-sn-glycerol-3-phosphate acyltransferase [Solirubrobacterales bacterium]